VDGSFTTRTVEDGALDALAPAADDGGDARAVLLVGGRPVSLWNPAMAVAAAAATRGGTSGRDVLAPMHGTILDILVAVGDEVQQGDPIAVLEAMKMETRLEAPSPGIVSAVLAERGAVVESGEIVASIN
jgi:biotin carboxyl carrier protein